MSSTGMVELTNVENRLAAEPLVQYLEANGITCHMDSDDMGGVDPALTFINGVDILVDGNKLGEARQLLEAWEKGELEEDWREDATKTLRQDAIE